MKDRINHIKTYVGEHRRETRIAAVIAVAIALVLLCVALYIYNTQSKEVKLTYSPVSACALLTSSEAKELLGGDILESNTNQATLSGNRATSKCSYTDKSATNMAVIGVAVRSAVNDQGVSDNKEDFAASKAANTVESVAGVGDEAFYIPANGQLSILDGRGWILITYGNGDDIRTHTLENAVKVARKVIDQAE